MVENFPGDKRLDRDGAQVPTESCYLKRKIEKRTTAGGPLEPEDNRRQDAGTGRRPRLKAAKVASPRVFGTPSPLEWPDSADYRFRHQVQRFLELTEYDAHHRDIATMYRIRQPKLLLDKRPQGEESRKELQQVLQQLRANGFIREDEDVICDLLTSFLHHCKDVLQTDHGFNDRSTVEVTFTVPICWGVNANATMAKCLTAAMRRAEFGVPGDSSLPNLFMVNEAEAAAIHALHSGFHDLNRGETFILVDCGGGTTDLGMYRVARSYPLRLETELSNPSGAATGASDLNERMWQTAFFNLCDEHYLCDPEEGVTIQNIIDTEIMPNFESDFKRDFKDGNRTQKFSFRIRGLRPSETNPRLQQGAFVLDFEDMWRIFEPSLLIIQQLIEDQVLVAVHKNITVDKIVLVGGFGDSPALKGFLQRNLERINAAHGKDIRLITTPP